MTTPFIGQLILAPFNFAPKNFALCNGQLLPINQNQALFSLLGTAFGGDGKTTFALPNLQGTAAVGSGGTAALGTAGGEANHTLIATEIPPHTHTLNTDARTAATSNTTEPAGNVLGQTAGKNSGGGPISLNLYSSAGPNGNKLAPAAVGPSGAQPHANLMPSLVINYCIALTGIYPTRN